MELTNHIEANPKIMMGKPVIKGTHITVEIILKKLSYGFDIRSVSEEFPSRYGRKERKDLCTDL